ncbi:MAG TPA: AMIN domain-containing protein [Terriglobales bacterium]|nr:AMIN domain-containing protein [Terriglobales bacterium]
MRSVAIEQSEDGPAVAIGSNGALVPAITKLDGPPRLVIDLAGAVNAVPRSRIGGSAGSIKSIRVSQYQQNPPLTRVVVDLSEARDYAWETVQNKLVVHLRRPEETANAPGDKAPAFTSGVEPAISYASGTPGATVHEVDQEISGPSTVTASEETTVLNLARGGQIRVCPGTTISVNSSQDRRDVMIGMSTGSLETHYALNDSADSVLTPDFRILLPGPGQFELAISADSRGNTCVRSLPGNTASAVVSELMGDGTYQVKANEEVVFHNGQLSKPGHDLPIDCGCPAAPVPILRTEAPPRPAPAETASASGDSAAAAEQVPAGPGDGGGIAIKMSVTAPEIAALKPNEIHMQVDAPLVFRGSDPLPAPTEEARKLPVTSKAPQTLAIIPLPPPVAGSSPSQPSKPRTGFLGRVKHFFSSVFG